MLTACLYVCGHLSQFSRVPRTRSIWTDSYSPKRGYSNVPTPPRKGVGNRAASFRRVVDFPAERAEIRSRRRKSSPQRKVRKASAAGGPSAGVADALRHTKEAARWRDSRRITSVESRQSSAWSACKAFTPLSSSALTSSELTTGTTLLLGAYPGLAAASFASMAEFAFTTFWLCPFNLLVTEFGTPASFTPLILDLELWSPRVSDDMRRSDWFAKPSNLPSTE